LRVTAATSFGEAFMPDLLVAFQARHPRLEIQLDLSVQLRNLLESGFDFGFRSARTVDERLVAKSVGVLRDIPVASPAFLARHGTPRTPADLEALPALRNTRIGGHADWTFSRAGETATIHMQGSFAASHHGPLRRVARLGAGIALLPEFLVADELASGHLVRLLPDYDVAPVPVYLVYAYRRHMPYRNRVFREFAIEWFAAPERAGTFA
jgi:DNA-binding transcriptional LysR family regulator